MTAARGARKGDRRSAVLLAVIITFLSGACAGGGGSEEDSGPACVTELSFASAISPVSDGDVYLQESANTCTTVDVSVLVANLSGIWTVGFDLTYPSAQVRYVSFTQGPLLKKGSPANQPFFFVSNPSDGTLQVTMTRFPPDPSVSAVGAEALITFRFSKVAVGTGMIDFDSSVGSTVDESIQDENGSARPASFGPGHGGLVTVP